MNARWTRIAGWMAYLNALLMVVGIVSLIVFFALIPTRGPGNIFGPINDYSSVIGSLVGLVVLFALFELHRKEAFPMALFALLLGAAGNLTLAAIQTLFLLKRVPLSATEITAPLGFAITGLGLILFARLGRRQATLPRSLTRLMTISGWASLLVVAAGLSLGWDGLPASLAGLAFVSFFVAWNLAFGRSLLANAPT